MTERDAVKPVWLTVEDANTIHSRQLAEHGGGDGTRDEGMLESALARPVNRWSYGETDLAGLAAAYAFGVARHHPFVDGNKRTAWVLARLFLRLNGVELDFDKKEASRTVESLAAGELSEADMADWFRHRTR